MFRFAVRLFSIFLPSVDFFEGCVRTKRFDVHSHDLHPVVGRRDLRVKIIQNSDVRHARMVADVDHVGNVIRPAVGCGRKRQFLDFHVRVVLSFVKLR